MLAAFAEAGRALGRPDYTGIATQNAEFLYTNLRQVDGRLLRSWGDGAGARYNAYLEDYAFLADGLLALYQTTFEPRWFLWARELAEWMLTHFQDPAGGFFDTSDDHEALLHRPKDTQDNATPSGNSMAAGVLLDEDVRDDPVARYLERRPATRERLYPPAVADVARAQRELSPLPATSVVASRAFDEDLLRWEVEHFREWALEARGITLGAEDSGVFAEAASTLAERIASWPRGFVHRDYQSRNLMVQEHADADPSLVWIDFQDALLGPRVYDLVALLNDSYQSFDRSFV